MDIPTLKPLLTFSSSSSSTSSSVPLQDWENNASRSVSLRVELEQVTQLIIQWRKLELR